MLEVMDLNEKINSGGVLHSEPQKVRDSNLELLRIIAMLLIIAHHFVVNSGITESYDFSNITPNMIFLQLWGIWGKTAINAFILISGYFMCTSSLTVKRFGKVYLEAKFYKTVIFAILLIAGYETLGVKQIFKLLFGYWYGIGNGFTSSFLAFYLLVPFYNLLIQHMDKRKHLWLIAILLFMYTVVGTFFMNRTLFSEPVWYAVLYFVAAYIRIYPSDWMSNNKLCGGVLSVSIFLAYASVAVVDFVGADYGFTNVYYMVADSHKFLAFIVGCFAFLFFKNLKIDNSKIINRIASTTFGVLCIHASSDAMRIFLWKNLLKVPDAFGMTTGNLVLFAAASTFGVFIACSLIDIARIKFVEKPVMTWISKYKWWSKELY